MHLKHEGTSGTQSFQCAKCSLSYTETNKMKLKHSSNVIIFPFPACGKMSKPEEFHEEVQEDSQKG